jgi:hypothetical protein
MPLLQGRQVIWAWLQDHPSPVSHDYAGCISLSRQLLLGVEHTPHAQQQQQQQQQQGLGTSQPSQQHAGSTSGAADGGSSSSSKQPSPSVVPNNNSSCSSSSSSSSSSSPEYYLIQRPLPELDRLRSGRGLRLKGIELPPNAPW